MQTLFETKQEYCVDGLRLRKRGATLSLGGQQQMSLCDLEQQSIG